jgi:hypothetical protein
LEQQQISFSRVYTVYMVIVQMCLYRRRLTRALVPPVPSDACEPVPPAPGCPR